MLAAGETDAAGRSSRASEALAWWAIRFVLQEYVWPTQRKDALKRRANEIAFAYKNIFGGLPHTGFYFDMGGARRLPRRVIGPRSFLWYGDELLAVYGFPTSCCRRSRIVEWNVLSRASPAVKALIDPELFAAHVVWWEHDEREIDRRKNPAWLQTVARTALLPPMRVRSFHLPWRDAEARSNPEAGFYLM